MNNIPADRDSDSTNNDLADPKWWHAVFAEAEKSHTKEWLEKFGLRAREAALVVGGYSMNPTPEEIGTIDYSRFEDESAEEKTSGAD